MKVASPTKLLERLLHLELLSPGQVNQLTREEYEGDARRLGREFPGPGGACLWAADATVSPPQRLWEISGRNVPAIAFSPDSRSLALCFGNGELIVVDAADGHRTRRWKRPSGVQSLAFAPDGRHLAVPNANGVVSLLRLETYR
jgi:WD40 repeat protein